MLTAPLADWWTAGGGAAAAAESSPLSLPPPPPPSKAAGVMGRHQKQQQQQGYAAFAEWVGVQAKVALLQAHAQCACIGVKDASCGAVVARAQEPHRPALLALWAVLLQDQVLMTTQPAGVALAHRSALYGSAQPTLLSAVRPVYAGAWPVVAEALTRSLPAAAAMTQQPADAGDVSSMHAVVEVLLRAAGRSEGGVTAAQFWQRHGAALHVQLVDACLLLLTSALAGSGGASGGGQSQQQSGPRGRGGGGVSNAAAVTAGQASSDAKVVALLGDLQRLMAAEYVAAGIVPAAVVQDVLQLLLALVKHELAAAAATGPGRPSGSGGAPQQAVATPLAPRRSITLSRSGTPSAAAAAAASAAPGPQWRLLSPATLESVAELLQGVCAGLPARALQARPKLLSLATDVLLGCTSLVVPFRAGSNGKPLPAAAGAGGSAAAPAEGAAATTADQTLAALLLAAQELTKAAQHAGMERSAVLTDLPSTPTTAAASSATDSAGDEDSSSTCFAAVVVSMAARLLLTAPIGPQLTACVKFFQSLLLLLSDSMCSDGGGVQPAARTPVANGQHANGDAAAADAVLLAVGSGVLTVADHVLQGVASLHQHQPVADARALQVWCQQLTAAVCAAAAAPSGGGDLALAVHNSVQQLLVQLLTEQQTVPDGSGGSSIALQLRVLQALSAALAEGAGEAAPGGARAAWARQLVAVVGPHVAALVRRLLATGTAAAPLTGDALTAVAEALKCFVLAANVAAASGPPGAVEGALHVLVPLLVEVACPSPPKAATPLLRDRALGLVTALPNTPAGPAFRGLLLSLDPALKARLQQAAQEQQAAAAAGSATPAASGAAVVGGAADAGGAVKKAPTIALKMSFAKPIGKQGAA